MSQAQADLVKGKIAETANRIIPIDPEVGREVGQEEQDVVRGPVEEPAMADDMVPRNGETVLCTLQQDTPAYDRKYPSRQVGMFKKGTTLRVGKLHQPTGMYPVVYVQDQKVVSAFCRGEDLKVGTQFIFPK